MPPEVTKGGPRPQRKDYKSDAAWTKAVEEWTKLNPPGTKPSPTTSSAPKPTPSVSTTKTPAPVSSPTTKVVDTENIESDVRQQSGAVRNDWTSFTDGSFNIQEGDATVGQTPYVTAVLEKYGEGKPTPVVILPDPQGKGFIVVAREEILQQVITQIQRNPDSITYWKTQLQNYYRSNTAFQTSLRGGPVTDKDSEFVFALRRALSEIGADNFSTGVENVKSGRLNPSGFYDVNSWITSRTPIPGRQSQSTTTRNFTLKADAIADFMREVQVQVGDPKLVDNVDALAEAYWDKVHAEELKRMGKGSSIYDPITNTTVNTSTGFQMPSEQLLKEWRLKFITKGAVEKNKVISTGIRNTSASDLQDAGGDLGDNYTKLKGYAFEYGVRLSDEELKTKAAEASLAGGSIKEQERTIQLASRLRYPSLAEYIQGGLKVSDIAQQFIDKKQSVLEIAAGGVDIFDFDVQAALTGDKLMNDIEYETKLRSNPMYRKTKQANEYAASFLDSVLKMWGKVG